MDTHKKLAEWIKKMGYDGEIPLCLKQFCNPSTEFIWQQIINKVKPKQEIEFMRRNIIINRLRKQEDSDLHCLDESFIKLPIEEFEVWKKKKELKERIDELNKQIEVKEAEINEIDLHNKIRYTTLQGVRRDNNEIKNKTFLCKEKSTRLKQELAETNEMLILLKNLTPVESVDGINKENVTQTLHDCARKLKEYVEEQSDLVSMSSVSAIASNKLTVFKPSQMLATSYNNKMVTPFATPRTAIRGQTLTNSMYLNPVVHMTNFSANFNSRQQKNFSSKNFTLPDKEDLYITIEELFTKNNNRFIMNILRETDKKYQRQLLDFIFKNETTEICNEKMHFIKLQAKYVEYELKCIKSSLLQNKLRDEIKRTQNYNLQPVIKQYNLQNQIPQLQSILKLQRKDAALEIALSLADKQLADLEQNAENSEDIFFIQHKLKDVENATNDAVDSLRNKIGLFNKNCILMSKIKYDICNLVKQQHQFTIDLSWAAPLSYSLVAKETEMFADFPLEFNRQFVTNSGVKVPMRDISLDLPFNKCWNWNLSRTLASVLDNPYSPPEVFLLKLVHEKTKTEAFQRLQGIFKILRINTYDIEEFQDREEQIASLLSKYKEIMFCESTRKTLNVFNDMEEKMKLWMEMPFKSHISPNRLFDGQPFQYYDKMFNALFQQL